MMYKYNLLLRRVVKRVAISNFAIAPNVVMKTTCPVFSSHRDFFNFTKINNLVYKLRRGLNVTEKNCQHNFEI